MKIFQFWIFHIIVWDIQSGIMTLSPTWTLITISDMSALKCWTASSLLCCSLSRSISLVCSERNLCTIRSLSLRLASIRACFSNSFSFSEFGFWGRIKINDQKKKSTTEEIRFLARHKVNAYKCCEVKWRVLSYQYMMLVITNVFYPFCKST